MSLKYEPSLKALHISVRQLFLDRVSGSGVMGAGLRGGGVRVDRELGARVGVRVWPGRQCHGQDVLVTVTAIERSETDWESQSRTPAVTGAISSGTARPLQGYLAHKKLPPPRTLQRTLPRALRCS